VEHLSIDSHQRHPVNLGQGDELTILGGAVRRCHQLQDSIGGNSKLAAFKAYLGFAGDLLGGIDCERLLSDRQRPTRFDNGLL